MRLSLRHFSQQVGKDHYIHSIVDIFKRSWWQAYQVGLRRRRATQRIPLGASCACFELRWRQGHRCARRQAAWRYITPLKQRTMLRFWSCSAIVFVMCFVVFYVASFFVEGKSVSQKTILIKECERYSQLVAVGCQVCSAENKMLRVT